MAEAVGTQLKVFYSMWGFTGGWHEAIARATTSGFDGLEVNLMHPSLAGLTPVQLKDALEASQLDLVVELISGGDYVPNLAISPEQHLAELADQLPRAERLQPERITLITGSDCWSDAIQDRFLEELLNLVEACNCPVSLETHRSRSLFNPWAIAGRLARHPRLRLTADLSHWCAVSERLITPELDLIRAMADRVDHIHARVGHAQGPSVSHPFAPESRDALEAHRLCWALFINSQISRGVKRPSITPEFGPDGYLPTLPFTNMPVADLLEINTSMAEWLKQGALSR
jgi:sugar phosphate isomerase/epimerase